MGFLRSSPAVHAHSLNALKRYMLGDCPEPLALLGSDIRLLAMNKAFTDWLQRGEAELLGRTFTEFVAPEARIGFVNHWEEVLSQLQTSSMSLRFVGEAARDADFIPLGNGPVLLVLRQPQATGLPPLGTQLIQSQKMETIGRLAGGLAHSFNNTLMGIIGYCELALMDLEPAHPVRAHLETVKQIGEKASDLTRQLLAYSRKQQLRIESVPVGALVRQLEPVLRHWLGGSIALTIECEDRWAVQADSNQLEQVLMNLVINARDAMPEGGKLMIKTRDFTVDESLSMAFEGLKPGDYGLLMVCDTGSGMSPEVLDNIFEPFFTTKERGRGTGLGLATVYGVVKQHGGYIGVASAEGIGTTFKLLLPAEAGVRDAIRAPAELHGREFLFLTRDKGWTHYCAKLLRDAGAHVHIGWNALVRLKRLQPVPFFDAILTEELGGGEEREQLSAAGLEGHYGCLLCVTDLCTLMSTEPEAKVCYLPKLLSREETLDALSARVAGMVSRRTTLNPKR